MSKRVLLISYPLLPVSKASAGGAEQILWTLERELAERGWQTAVAACSGSRITGELIATGEPPQARDGFVQRELEHSQRIIETCATREFDIVLDHSGHFFRHASRINAPVLATLHLPRAFYTAGIFDNLADNLHFNCVSDSQMQEFTDLPRMLHVVRNGIAIERFPMGRIRSDYLLWLGRVCPEKAPHLAIAAAKQAGLPIVIAGQVYPFNSHQQYWEETVKPLIDADRVRWVPLPSFTQKTKLLRETRALLVTSLVAETTSLVALEAMACGTPVIAFARGALKEVVPKSTGFLVANVPEMAAACANLSTIRAHDCRWWVEHHYSARAMTEGYEELISNLDEQKRWEYRSQSV